MARIRESFIVTTDPWTLNGEPIEATTPPEVLTEIRGRAHRFPVLVTIEDGAGEPIHLVMPKRGNPSAIDERPDDAPEPVMYTVPAADEETPDETDLQEPAPDGGSSVGLVDQMLSDHASVDAGIDDPAAKSVATPRRRRGVIIAGTASVAVLALAGTAAAIILPGSSAQDEQGGWSIEGAPESTMVLGDTVVTVTGDQATLYDAATGEQITDPVTVDEPRVMDGEHAQAMDTGTGETLIIRDGQTQTYPGTLNARGTDPLVIESRSYTTADGEQSGTPEGYSVIGASGADEVVRIKAPAIIERAGEEAELSAPEPGASLAGLIQGSTDQVVSTWTADDTTWLSVNDTETGAVLDAREVQADAVRITDQVVWADQSVYLDGERFASLCEQGEQIGAYIACPTGAQWELPGLGVVLDEKPIAVSDTYLVTQDHRVLPMEDHS